MISAVSGPTRIRMRFATGTRLSIGPRTWFCIESSGIARAMPTSQGWMTAPTSPVS